VSAPHTGAPSLPANLRVALVHDWLTGMRGGEKVLEEILGMYPGADIFTLLHRKGHLSPAIEAARITTSFIQRLPGAATRYRSFLPLFPAAIESFNLSGYDLVISTSHCVAKGVVTGPGTCHLSYCFTPMRYIWDQYEAYFGHLRGVRAAVIRRVARHLRRWDAGTASRVDSFLTLSRYVGDRIRRHYGRDSRVVYPPVDTAFFTPGNDAGEGGYYLAVSALVPYKRLDLLAAAARDLPFPVRIVGAGPEEARLREVAGPSVEFLGWVGGEALRDLYRGCRALLFPGEEDFGLTPVEAMACGKPVVAFGRGGVAESVVAPGAGHGPPTGVFFDRQEPAALVAAVGRLEAERSLFTPEAARARALLFSRERFREGLAAAVAELHAEWAGGRSARPAARGIMGP
jgi:glycosyltransferase involved in cell wall biosynthesis